MKLLITTACVCVIAATGYYFYGEFQGYRQRAAMNEANEPIRRDLFRKAQASDDDAGLAKVHSFCNDMQRSLGGDMASDYTKTMVRSCSVLGYL